MLSDCINFHKGKLCRMSVVFRLRTSFRTTHHNNGGEEAKHGPKSQHVTAIAMDGVSLRGPYGYLCRATTVEL